MGSRVGVWRARKRIRGEYTGHRAAISALPVCICKCVSPRAETLNFESFLPREDLLMLHCARGILPRTTVQFRSLLSFREWIVVVRIHIVRRGYECFKIIHFRHGSCSVIDNYLESMEFCIYFGVLYLDRGSWKFFILSWRRWIVLVTWKVQFDSFTASLTKGEFEEFIFDNQECFARIELPKV